MESEKVVTSLVIKDQAVEVGGEKRETVEEFLARGGVIEEVPIRSGDEVISYLKEQGKKRSQQALGTSRPLSNKKEGPQGP